MCLAVVVMKFMRVLSRSDFDRACTSKTIKKSINVITFDIA